MRASGVLMHVTSLPGPNGIGAMGESARRFVDFLAQAGQRYWQILPLSPTGYGNSPYQSLSTFAGNQYLIDLETLVEEGLLRREEVDAVSWNHAQPCVPSVYPAPAGLASGLRSVHGPERGVPGEALAGVAR